MNIVKRLFENNIKLFIGVLIGLIISGSIGVVAYTLLAKDVSYTPTWTKENGESITNVKDAIDELYIKSNDNIDFTKIKDVFYNDILTTVSTTTRTNQIKLDKGEYILVVLDNCAWNQEISNISEVNEHHRNLNSSNINTTVKEIYGRQYLNSGTSNLVSSTITNVYYVKIFDSNDILQYEYYYGSTGVIPATQSISAIKLK